MHQEVPNEVQLLLLLSRTPQPPADIAHQLCTSVSDWDFFLRLARLHRLTSLIAKNATATSAPLPDAIRAQLHKDSAANAIEAFRYLTELQRLLTPLAEAGIHPAVLKGLPLSLQAYGDIATRDVGDIDLLIQPEEAEASDAILLNHGYQRREPAGKLTPRRRASYAEHFKDYTYEPNQMQTQGGFEIDLHWRLFRTPEMPGNDLGDFEPGSVSAGNFELKTLAPPSHLLYLSVLGALDGWTRFKSIADIAALWNASDKPEVLETARETAVLPYLFAALSLAHTWIGGLDLPPGFQVESTLKHPLTRHIVDTATQNMRDYQPDLRIHSSWSAKRYEASLHKPLSYKMAIARRILFRPRVWTRFDLPDPLFPLYPLLSPVEWLLYHAQPGRKQIP